MPQPDVYELRSNNGSYPDGFYYALRLFVVDSVATSVVLMRIASAAACLALMVLAGLVTDRADRWRLWLYWLVGAVPLGLFLFASVNPSGVAVAGAAAAFAAATAALKRSTQGWPAWPAAALATAAALLAVSSRSDSVFFCGLAMACALVVGCATRWPGLLRQLALLAPVGAVLVVAYISSHAGGSAGAFSSGAAAEGRQAPTEHNVYEVLQFYLGSFAMTLGWLDVPMPSLAWGTMALALGAALGYGVGGLGWRRAVALSLPVGLALILPVYMLEGVGYPVGAWVQPRYMLPLVMIILGLLALHGADPGVRPNRRHLLWMASLATVGHSMALHVVMRRYIAGLDVGGLDLNASLEWWWDAPVKPMTTWAIGSVAFAALSVILAARAGLGGRPAADEPDGSVRAQETAPVLA